MPNHYIYLHRRASDGRIFYVGKGKGNRAWVATGRNRHWHNVAKKHGYTVSIYRDNLAEACSFSIERALIAAIGRDNLCNLTDGGEGASGRIVGENERRVKSQALKGKPGRVWTDEERNAKRISQTGIKHKDETRRKISALKKGKRQPWAGQSSKRQDVRDKISASKKGMHAPWLVGERNHMHRPEMKAILSARCKGVPRVDMVGELNPSARAVICIETGDEFKTMKSAAEWLVLTGKTKNKKSSTNINSVCLGNLKTAYGLTWKYLDNKKGGD